MEQTFRKIQKEWNTRVFLLEKFTGFARSTADTISNTKALCQTAVDDVRFIILGKTLESFGTDGVNVLMNLFCVRVNDLQTEICRN